MAYLLGPDGMKIDLPTSLLREMANAKIDAMTMIRCDLGDHKYTPEESARLDVAMKVHVRSEAILLQSIRAWLRDTR